MKTKPLSNVFTLLVLLLSVSCSFAGKVVYEKSFPAKGGSDIVVPLTSWGRFSFQVTNPEGSALELIDKKVGSRGRSGSVGMTNGRIDEYLDVGEYKIKATSSQKGNGTAKLRVYDYSEINSPQYIVPLKQYEGTLKDLEKASYWIHLKRSTTITLEALGRNVDDIQIWKNGEYREPAMRTEISAYPMVETPLKGFRVVQNLQPGYYQITVYGGKGLDWSENSSEHPFYIKMNEQVQAASGMGNYTIGGKGYEQFWVNGTMRRAIVSTAKKEDITLDVYQVSTSSPNYSFIASDSIHEKSREPRCIVQTYSSGTYLVRVSGKPGTTFSLQTFEKMKSRLYANSTGSYWISTMHSGFGQDMVGVSGGIVQQNREGSIINSEFDTLSSRRSINRRFNLLGTMSMYVWVDKADDYLFLPHKNAKITVERYFYNSSNKRVSRFTGRKRIPLRRGLHKIILTPEVKGIVTLTIKRNSLLNSVGTKDDYERVREGLQFPSQYLKRHKSYSLLINSLSPEIGTVIMRKLPINPSEPLTIRVKKGETFTVPITLSDESKLEALYQDGAPCAFVIDKNPLTALSAIKKGRHTVSFKAPKDGMVCVKATSTVLLPTTPPKPFPVGTESPLPMFTQINPEDTLYLDMKRSDKRTYEFIVTKPGIYEFATSGRLRTSLTLRDRFTTSLDRKTENGIGRNAQMMHYLLPGKYQSIVKTLGNSTGKMGLRLALISKIDGGTLTTLQEKRNKVPAGKAISYLVDIEEDGTYSLESQGQSGYFPIRFDDADGWPLVKPGSSGDISQSLEAGTYQMVSLSQQQDRVRIARLTRTEETVSYNGKGMHTLKLNRRASSIWNEEKSGEKRKAATFTLSMSAPAQCRLSLTEDFTGILFKDGDSLFSWSGSLHKTLPMGELTISVLADKEQNHKEYELSVQTDELVPGLTKMVSSGNSVTVSVGETSVVELLSQGMLDVAATLYDKSGTRKLDYSDDGTNDWNFKISRLLPPGKYKLKINSRGRNGSTKILMRSLKDTLHTDLRFFRNHSLDMAGKINSVLFSGEKDREVFQAEILGSSNVGALLEKKVGNDWSEVGRQSAQDIRLTAPIQKDADYRLSFWSTDHLNEKVTLHLQKSSAEAVTLAELEKGVKSKVKAGAKSSYLWYLVDLKSDSLGHFTVGTKNGTSLLEVRATSATDTIFTENPIDRMVSSLHREVWVGLKLSSIKAETVKMEPFRLSESTRFLMGDEPSALVLNAQKQHLTLLTTEMKMGTPLCGTPTTKAALFSPAGIPLNAGTLDYGNSSALLITPADDKRVLLWNGDHIKGITTPTTAVVSEKLIPYKSGVSLTYGINPRNLKAGRGVEIPLALDGTVSVGCALPPYSVAMWKRPDGSSVTKRSNSDVTFVQFIEGAGKLYLVNSGTEDKNIEIECRAIPHGVGPSTGFTKGLYETYQRASSTLNLPLTEIEKGTKKLYYSGNIRRVDRIRGDGLIVRDIQSGDLLQATKSSGGELLVHHDKGWVQLALSEESTAKALWGGSGTATGKSAITRPEMKLMSGATEWFSLSSSEEKHLRLQSNASLVTVLLKESEVVKTYVGSDGASFDIPLTKGEYTLGVRRLGGAQMSDVPVEFSLYPIKELTDTLPLSMTFAPGQSRLVTFDIAKESPIGLGVQTNREVVLVTLLDENREVINRGQQQYLTLDKGRYYVQLTVPNESEPAECTIKLFGQHPPADTPPEKLVRKFRAYAK